MKKVLLVFAVSAVLILLLASAAFAQNYGEGAMNASPTATASATASPTASATATASPTATATATATAMLAQLLVQPLRPAHCPQPADHRWAGRLPGWPP